MDRPAQEPEISQIVVPRRIKIQNWPTSPTPLRQKMSDLPSTTANFDEMKTMGPRPFNLQSLMPDAQENDLLETHQNKGPASVQGLQTY